MKNAICTTLVFIVTGVFVFAIAGDVLAQAGTEADSGTPGMKSGRPGPTIDIDKEPGANRGNALSGDSPDSIHRSSQGMGMAQVPAGIGERGTGQTQSTLERSGGGQSRSSQGMTSDIPAGTGERGTGQTPSTERSGNEQGRVPQAMAPMPPSE